MQTITINVYTAEELRDQYPEGYKYAHERFIEMEWDSTATWWITDTVEMVADEHGSPLAGRDIEWDVYRRYAHYSDGPLTSEEGAKFMGLFPDLYGVSLSLYNGELHGDVEFAPDEEEAKGAVELADKWLRDLHAEMALSMQGAVEGMESEANFIDTCDANGWTFEADGRIRNV
jgi:hypothetical protein